jgi:antirestriction protein ArdC
MDRNQIAKQIVAQIVAELGAAILCGTLGVSVTPREDHAKYLNNWMRVLENNPASIFTAFSKSQASVDYLYGLQSAPVAIAA